METGEPLIESGGGTGNLFTVRFRGVDGLIQRFHLFVEVGICFAQLPGDLLQTGFLSGRKRGEKILIAGASFLNGLIEHSRAIG